MKMATRKLLYVKQKRKEDIKHEQYQATKAAGVEVNLKILYLEVLFASIKQNNVRIVVFIHVFNPTF